MTVIQAHNYQCKFCEKRFIKESWYLAHKCKQMRRAETLQSVDGQAAWDTYQTWMLFQKKVVSRTESFIDSRFFNSLLKFVKWSRDVGIPDRKIFIRFMVEQNISPLIWTNDEIYTSFLEYFDLRVAPLDHVRIAVDTLLDLCEEYECEASHIFEKIDPNVVIINLRQRKLSPWLLLNSKAFRHMFANRTTEHQKIVLQTLIRYDHWKKQFDKNKSVLDEIKIIIQSMGA